MKNVLFVVGVLALGVISCDSDKSGTADAAAQVADSGSEASVDAGSDVVVSDAAVSDVVVTDSAVVDSAVVKDSAVVDVVAQ